MPSGSFLDVINSDIQNMTAEYSSSGIFPAASSSILFNNLKFFDATVVTTTPPSASVIPIPDVIPPVIPTASFDPL